MVEAINSQGDVLNSVTDDKFKLYKHALTP